MERDKKIDILKGCSILLVVLGHTRFIGTHFIYLFHMAIFFMASGYFYKASYSETFKSLFQTVLKRLKGLWLPFVIWNTIYTLLNNIFIKFNIYTDNEIVRDYLAKSLVSIHKRISIKEMLINIVKGFFLAGHTEMGGAFWFLRILFYISVAYVCVDFILKRFIKVETTLLICQGIISLVFLVLGFFMGKKGISVLAIDRMFSCYCLYYLGMMLHKSSSKMPQKMWIYCVLIPICFGALLFLGTFGTVSLGDNNYINPAFMLVASIVGWIMIYSLSVLLEKVGFLKGFLSYLGKNSIIVVIFHFLFFKPINLLVSFVKGWPIQTVAGFPVSCNEGAWWVLYTIVSVGLCLIVAFIWNSIKRVVPKRNQNS